MSAFQFVLLVAFPYVATTVFVVGTLYRWRSRGFTVTSLSSQFLEGRRLFWGSIPFHVGILVLFLGHLIAFLLPATMLAWNRQPVRLLVLEATGLAFGLSTLIGIVALMARRFTHPRVRVATDRMDVVVEGLLLAQIALGVWVAVGYRWGSSWAAADLAPYLGSLLTLSPDPAAVMAMPWGVKLHVAGGFAILFLIPFSRLAHLVVAPLDYLVRPYQQVIWNWNPRTIRDPRLGWSVVPMRRRALVLPEPEPEPRRVIHIPPDEVERLRAGLAQASSAARRPRELVGLDADER